MRFLTNNSTDPHYNMSFDEYCLEQLSLDDPVFYLWQNRPSVIVGLSQSVYSEVNLQYLEQKNITLARRVTGGGAVYHDLQNLNYTIVGKSADLDKDYPDYLHHMINALTSLGVPATLSGRNDIMVDGRKCSGYAKRVYKDRLMIHGTLMFDVDIDELTKALAAPGSKLSASGVASVRSRVANLKDYLPQYRNITELKDALREILSRNSSGGHDLEVILPEDATRKIQALSDEKFSTWQWNFGHSPKADFMKKKKFACGTIEASFSINHGLIRDLTIGGDFLGNLTPEAVATALEGCRYDVDEIEKVLSNLSPGIEQYFDKMTPKELSEFLLDIQNS